MANPINTIKANAASSLSLTEYTRLRSIASKLAAGINLLPQWQEGMPVDISDITGASVYDEVTFMLDENNIIGPYVNYIATNTTEAKYSTTYINGRTGPVYQLTSQPEETITFNMSIFSKFLAVDHDDGIRQQISLSPNPFSAGNYLPDTALGEIYDFIKLFWSNSTYSNVWVISKYLNDVLGIDYILPMSIQGGMNPSVTNRYDIVMQAKSYHYQSSSEIADEIIPNV